MSSPVLSKDEAFQPGHQRFNGVQPTSGFFSIEGVALKTGLLFGILLVGAGIGWFFLPSALMLPLVLGTLVLGLVISFKKSVNRALISIYAGAQGLLLGGLSGFFEGAYPGIVMQAVLATLCVFGVTLLLYSMRIVRATPKVTRFFLIAIAGYALFAIVNLGLQVFGVVNEPFGLYGADIPGTNIPFGFVIGALAVLLAAFSLILDFSFIEQGVNNRLDSRYEWQASFGLMVTLIWLYIEFLRLFALARSN